MMACKSLTLHLLVAAFVLATLAFVGSEAGIDKIRRRLSGMRHNNGYGPHGFLPPTSHHHQPGFHQHQHQHHIPSVYGHQDYHHEHPHNHHNHHSHHQPHYAPAPVFGAPHQQVHYPQNHLNRGYRFEAPHVRHGYDKPVHGGGAAASSAAAAGGHGASASGSAASGGYGGHGGAAASSAAAAGGHGAGNGASAAAVEEVYDEHYEEPENENVYAAQSGTYANDGDGHESSSYVRETENVENHEDGREDDNHYYNAHSYGKTFDENKHEAYNNDDEDVLHTPNVYRSKKSKTNFVSNLNKARRESGSGVLAHDKHSASYNKNSKKFNEKVDQRYNKDGHGAHDSEAFSSAIAQEDEDEDRYDSDNLGDFVGVDGRVHHKHPGFIHGGGVGGGAAASSSAASDANGQGVVTSSVAAGRNAAASAAGAAH